MPPQPWSVFSAIQREIIAKNLGFIATARLQGLPSPPRCIFTATSTAIVSSERRTTCIRKLRPNNLVMGPRFAALRTRHALSDPDALPFDNEGLRRSNLPGSERDDDPLLSIQYQRQILDKSETAPADFTTNSLTDCLCPMNRLAGALIYPHLD